MFKQKISEEEVKKLQEYIGEEVIVSYRDFASKEENTNVAYLKGVNDNYIILTNEDKKEIHIDFCSFKQCILFIDYEKDGIYEEIYDGYQKYELISSTFIDVISLEKISLAKKYYYIIAGLPLVKKELQKRWIVFVEYFGLTLKEEERNKLLNLIISILIQMQKRMSYELIYRNLQEDNNVCKEEILAVLEIVSNFTDGGKFLKEYIINKMNKEGLNLTLQK